MAKSYLRVVRGKLQGYADRGVFRGFTEVKDGDFRFLWLIDQPMELIVDPAKDELRFRHLLPGVPPGSAMYADLKRFVEDRHDDELPGHRRVDRNRAEASCRNRGGFVSVYLKVRNNQYAYGLNRIVNLVHELFLHLRQSYPDYLAENLNVAQE